MNHRPEDKPADGGFPVIDADNSSLATRFAKKKQGPPWALIGIGGGGIVVVLVIALVLMTKGGKSASLFEQNEKMLFAEVHTPMVTELANAELAGQATYTLDRGPKGCVVEPDGTLRWTPTRGGDFTIQVSAIQGDGSDRKETRQWTIIVDAPNQPPKLDPIATQTVRVGETLELRVHAVDPDDPSQKLVYRLLKGSPRGAKIDNKQGLFSWTPETMPSDGKVQVRVAAIEAVPGGLGTKQTFTVRILPQEEPSVAVEEKPVEEELPEIPKSTGPIGVELAEAERKKLKAELLEIYDENQVFILKSYPEFRRIYARRFELDYEHIIEAACGEDAEQMKQWFGEHPEIKEELYTAIDPEADNVDQTLKIFVEIVKRFPKSFPAFSEAAIATAVTWDAGPRSFGYGHHQRRVKGIMPEGRIDGVDNFGYLAEAKMVLGRRVSAMPWEFLVHVVDHPTPVVERRWAVQNYLDKQVGIGECYKDVPYDTGLLNHGGDHAMLNGHEYSLPTLRQFGGVCAHQADFASRVGKSLGVPAIYTSGESRSLDRHAWVLWVELLNATKNRVQFEVKSYGRYRGDKYYVGSLSDPKTRKRVTDRQLELRLHNIGFGVQNKRQAELIMRTYPLYRESRSLDVDTRLRFLGEVIRLSPGTESAWIEIARMSADHEITAKDNRRMQVVLNQFFKTFANFPDFTWTVFEDLIAYRDNPKEAAALYEKLISMYVQAKRPDLGCKAVLHYADFVSEQGWNDRAIDALATMTLVFPGEGRYVPKMLDRLEGFIDESLAVTKKKSEVRQTQEKLVAFYKELVPKIPKTRNGKLTEYCEKMYQRAISFFERTGDTQTAAMVRTELMRLQAEREIKKQS